MNDSRVIQVTNITHSATDAELSDLFSVAGNVARTSIIQTGFPYYAFLEYYNPSDAKRALHLHGKFFGPSKITVELSSQPFPQQPLLGKAPSYNNTRTAGGNTYNNNDKNYNKPLLQNHPEPVVQISRPKTEEVTRLSLSNIPVTLKEHNLHQIFSEFGTVVDTNVVTDNSGLKTGRGSVSFSSYESASKAATAMNGKVLEGGYSGLHCDIQSNDRSYGPGPITDLRQNLSNNNRHHPYNNTQHQHNSYPNIPFPNTPNNQQPFLTSPPTHYPNNATTTNTFNIHGGAQHSLTTQGAVPSTEPAAVYAANLPDTSCKSCLLYQLFAPYGAIISVRPMTVPAKGNTWYGFINYKDYNCAITAIATLDKSELDGNPLKVSLKQFTNKPYRPSYQDKTD